MSIQKFPIAAVHKIRQHIQAALMLPESERHPPALKTTFEDDEEPPEPGSLDALGDLFKFGAPPELQDPAALESNHQWLVSAVNPGAALVRLPGLQLKSDVRLVSYLYRSEENARGIVWAVPEDHSSTAELEAVLEQPTSTEQPPKPMHALQKFMMAIEGDRSPASYLIASILHKELIEFGSLGRYKRWSFHQLVEKTPEKANFQWRVEQPHSLSPRVKQFPDGRVAVEFFSCRVVAPIALFRHVDQYAADSYVPNSLDRVVAVMESKKK